ncbi:response regulator transcription factor [Paenibacillus typhae]|uniref:DNA-binding response regulator, OmpR family, contains REC and winged-helix (WHTH) domain n=2 Tax=Paenibacillus typhae TaxID=1174501 RepID=A0A1G8PUA5_9BACL|nr:response regulator transcription factor [Paenibacillus typhae]MBY0010639.1 response regulator transcription factor [Paenibacillus typhae]SDI96047.1 DNA-binding response regulator, OmpR family, contains REC and winged-helix (wHTH) domain [Paenibacillus typhae]
MFRIMIIEDDVKIRHIVADTLRKWKYEVTEVTQYEQILEEFRLTEPHLVLLDVNLPLYDGFYWCQQIRSVSKVPVIFLSSRTQNMDVIMAINMGADDYIQKPFDLSVLVAKISAMLRRNYTYQDDNLQLVHRQLIFNLSASSIRYGDGTAELSRNEFIILQTLMRSTGKIVSRDELMQVLWNDDQFVDDNTLTVNVNRLRRKIALLGPEDFIATRKGMGYIIE